jgi:hypothetical protein
MLPHVPWRSVQQGKGNALEQTNQRSNQSGSQTASQSLGQTPAQPVNRWQPITDVYQQEAEVFAPPAVTQPPKPVPVPVSQRDLPKSSVPMSLHIITGLFFLRALVYFILGGKLATDPDSDFSQRLVSLSGILVPFTVSHRHPEMFVKLIGEALLVLATISLVVGILWLVRWWVIRWVTMCYSGGMVLRIVIRNFAGAAAGVHTGPLGNQIYYSGSTSGIMMGLSSDEITAVLLFTCALNLLIFCYLAFYPGVSEAFEKPL